MSEKSYFERMLGKALTPNKFKEYIEKAESKTVSNERIVLHRSLDSYKYYCVEG